MEIRLIIISDSGQTTPYEFKTLEEAGDFCYLKANPIKVMSRDEQAAEMLKGGFSTEYTNVDPDTITESTAPGNVVNMNEKPSFISRLFNK